MVEVVRLDQRYPRDIYRQVAQLHASSIHHGVLPKLGLNFLVETYAAVAESVYGFVLVAKEREIVLGFVAGSVRLHQMFMSILLKKGWLLGLAAGNHLRQRALWKMAWSVLSFPRRENHFRDASCRPPELLAIAVKESMRRSGLGSILLRAFENEVRKLCQNRTYTVATNSEETISNQFYSKAGFYPIGTMAHHQLTLQLYEKKL